ncbi:MAG: lysophospholipid acyltransferase family protein [Deltaproteobacteria bacterium]|nr:lysophospholipid acyltransferase family protein [Deltaproteobacteria bacterium]
MASGFRKILKTKFFHAFLYRFIRLYSSTFRIQVENEKQWMEHLGNGGKVVLCTWHQQFFAAIRHFQTYRHLKPSLMISKSSDGEIIADVAERSGWHTVRGSSSRDGRQALKAMIDRLGQFGLAAHVVDGPKGPAGIVKAGVIQLARAADAVIVPFYTSADRAWYFNSWDRYFLPKPFARVVISFGDMIKLSTAEDSDAFERQRFDLERIMVPQMRVAPAGKLS